MFSILKRVSLVEMTEATPNKALLLITGAWHTPEHYAKLTSRLIEKGVRVLCPRLPTNNNAYPPNKYLEDDVAFIREIAAAEAAKGTHLTVLAHSWGGMVASDALTALALDPHNKEMAGGGGVAALIFLAAFVPLEGESLAGIFGGTLPPFLTTHDDDTLRWTDPVAHLYDDLPPDEAAAMEGMRVWHSSRAEHTGIAADKKAAWRVVPSLVYIVCDRDNALPPPAQEMMIARVRGEGLEVREFHLPAGHSAFASLPDELANCVLDVMEL